MMGTSSKVGMYRRAPTTEARHVSTCAERYSARASKPGLMISYILFQIILNYYLSMTTWLPRTALSHHADLRIL
jgi:hypothetical protein